MNATPAPKPSKIMLGRTSTTKLPSTGARAKSTSPTADNERPVANGRSEAKPQDQLRGEPERERRHDQVGRQEGETDLQRAVPEDELEIESGEEKPGEHGRGPEDADYVGCRDIAELEEPERHEWRASPSLDPDEQCQQHCRRREQAERLSGGPAFLVAVHDCVDREHQGRRHRHGAGDVETPAGRLAAAARDQPQAEDEDHYADRKVDEEDPVPIEHVRENAAEQYADASAAGRDESDHAHRLRPLGGLGEQGHDQGESDHRHDSPTEALDGSSSDQERLRVRKTAAEGGDGEEPDSGQEEPPMAKEISQASAEQEKAAEGQDVRVHDPGERRLGEPKVGPDRWQCDVHDRRVEDDHQIAQTEDDQREPAGAVVGDGHRTGPFGAFVIGFSGLDRTARPNSSFASR